MNWKLTFFLKRQGIIFLTKLSKNTLCLPSLWLLQNYKGGYFENILEGFIDFPRTSLNSLKTNHYFWGTYHILTMKILLKWLLVSLCQSLIRWWLYVWFSNTILTDFTQRCNIYSYSLYLSSLCAAQSDVYKIQQSERIWPMKVLKLVEGKRRRERTFVFWAMLTWAFPATS